MADNESTTETTDVTPTEENTNSEATIYDDLRREYDGYKETSAAAVAKLQAEKAEAEAKLQAVMAHNYELVTAISNTPDPTATTLDQDADTDEVVLEPLFTYDD